MQSSQSAVAAAVPLPPLRLRPPPFPSSRFFLCHGKPALLFRTPPANSEGSLAAMPPPPLLIFMLSRHRFAPPLCVFSGEHRGLRCTANDGDKKAAPGTVPLPLPAAKSSCASSSIRPRRAANDNDEGNRVAPGRADASNICALKPASPSNTAVNPSDDCLASTDEMPAAVTSGESVTRVRSLSAKEFNT